MERILVVEDSSAMRAYMRAALEADGVGEVVEAGSGFDALRLLARETFTLALLDINLPDVSGLELVAFVRRSDATRDLPLVMVTTEGRAADRDRACALGASGYVTKPFTPDALLAVLRPLRPGAPTP